MNPSTAHEANPRTVLDNLTPDDRLCLELRWSLFSSAVNSYRTDTLLRPFPPQFLLENGDKDLESLRRCISSMPDLSNPELITNISEDHLNLLLWLNSCSKYTLQNKELTELQSLRQKTNESIPVGDPNHVYEILYPDHVEEAFSNRAEGKNRLYAYHGSRVENFYSITMHGLHSHMNKTSLFGEGTYLTTEPTVAMGFSPWSHTGWKHASIGESMSILALCEVIEDPSVKISTSSSSSGRRAPNSEAGDIPDKYIVVTNNDMIRVKYLLVFTKNKISARLSTAQRRRQPNSWQNLVLWIHQHGAILHILFYCLVLFIIGLASSKTFWIRVQHMFEEVYYNLEQWSAGDSIR